MENVYLFFKNIVLTDPSDNINTHLKNNNLLSNKNIPVELTELIYLINNLPDVPTKNM